MLKSITLAFALGITGPALALGSFPSVPSTWPADNAFGKGKLSQTTSTKGIMSEPILKDR